MTPKIKSIATAVPEELWTNEKISELTGADPEFIKEKIGVEKRYFLKPEESGIDLSAKACRALFEKTNIDISKIGLLVFVTQTPDFKIPQSSSILHEALDLENSCAAFDISLGCSGYVYALSATKGMMLAQNIENAVLVTCDPYSKIMDQHDKNTMTIFGDAATATLISNDGTIDIGFADLGTDGGFASSLMINAGGACSPVLGIHNEEPKHHSNVEDTRINMKGREVFNFVVRNVPSSIEKCLTKNNTSIEEIDVFALHQGSKHMLDYMAKQVPIPDEKMLRNIHEYGNTVSSTVPMLLQPLIDHGKTDIKVLVSGFGVGLSWATNILTFN